MMRWLFLSVAVCVGPSAHTQISGDSLFEAATRRGIENVYNLEFEKAEAEFSTLVALRPGHPAGPFFHAMVTWWRIMVDMENRQYDEGFYETLESVVAMCDSMLGQDENDIEAIFFKGGAIGFEGRLRFHRDDWLAAANAGRKALPLVRRANDLDPTNYDIYLGTGIYNYYASVIPEEYPVVKPLLLFIPAGDKKKGLRDLTTAGERARYAAVESMYFLMQIYYMYERDYAKALALADTLHTRFPGNMVFHKYLGRCLVVMGNYQRAEETFQAVLTKVRQGARGYSKGVERESMYYLGTCALEMRRLDDALGHLYRCDELSRTLDAREPSGFMTMANLKIGMVYDLQGRHDLAKQQYTKVLSLPSYKDTHVQAERYLKKPYAQ